MSCASEKLRNEIEHCGPIAFSRFMEVALYDAECGYYRTRDPFGRRGDFYTAEQIQPVFGLLVESFLRRFAGDAGRTVVELGAGRAEMRDAFRNWDYIPMDAGADVMPGRFSGVVFSNEFFDALPVGVARVRDGALVEMCVRMSGSDFVWAEGGSATAMHACGLTAHEEGTILEIPRDLPRWVEQIAARLERGYVVTIDYGYTRSEAARFPQGTLLSYRKHQALADVLARPGEQDITAHVCFSCLEAYGRRAGLETVSFESLASALLRAGEADGFASVLEAQTEAERIRRRLQLKTLLFGMGETFRVLVQRKRGEQERPEMRNGPDCSGP